MKYDKDIKSKAQDLFENGMELKTIALQLDLKESTVRSWKSRGKWVQKCNAATQRRVAKKHVQNVAEVEELSEQQELFCLLFSRSFNATKAYQEAYGCSYQSAMVGGSRLLKKEHIKKEVARLKEERFTIAFLSAEDIFQKYMDIAFADIGDYLEFNEMEVPVVVDGTPIVVDGETLKTKKNIVVLKDSKEVDTSLLQEVKEGREGVSVKLCDKMKALEWLASHMDMGTIEQRARVDKMKAETEKLKLEAKALSSDDSVHTEIDDFVSATRMSEEEVKDLFGDKDA